MPALTQPPTCLSGVCFPVKPPPTFAPLSQRARYLVNAAEMAIGADVFVFLLVRGVVASATRFGIVRAARDVACFVVFVNFHRSHNT